MTSTYTTTSSSYSISSSANTYTPPPLPPPPPFRLHNNLPRHHHFSDRIKQSSTKMESEMLATAKGMVMLSCNMGGDYEKLVPQYIASKRLLAIITHGTFQICCCAAYSAILCQGVSARARAHTHTHTHTHLLLRHPVPGGLLLGHTWRAFHRW